MTDADDSPLSEKEKELNASMNPLKSHFGLDIGLPRPLSRFLNWIIFGVVSTVRLALYTIASIITFTIAYIASISIYCSMYSGGVITCVQTQYDSLTVLLGAIGCTAIVIGTIAIIDYKVDHRKYY